MREALFYESKGDNQVQCLLCPRQCRLQPGKTGSCRVRINQQGKLQTLNFGRVSAYALDPIEKKPLYHFYPGRTIFSLGTVGCNFTCQFCQNWRIAQAEPTTIKLTPEQTVDIVQQLAAEHNCIGLAFTYSEPLVWYEYVLETAEMVQQAGGKNVLVTNGFIQEKPFQKLLPLIDALNIDVKAFSSDFYRRWCKGDLAPVLRTVEQAVQHCHVELTTLLIPDLNDSEAEIRSLVEWVAGLDPDIPLHFSRYFPNYQFDRPATPIETMEKAYDIAREKLNYVYLGNLPGNTGSNTFCPECFQVLIERQGYQVEIVGLADQKCINCGEKINLVL
ncbi:MAG: AmmeMemoRadiSam system radical SAM enzyme [Syntrophomonadaceae bacterium]|nr:AmmeMemoRadiSam system radical SAM enzyme [Syntrophomonadaceae bacterium]